MIIINIIYILIIYNDHPFSLSISSIYISIYINFIQYFALPCKRDERLYNISPGHLTPVSNCLLSHWSRYEY